VIVRASGSANWACRGHGARWCAGIPGRSRWSATGPPANQDHGPDRTRGNRATVECHYVVACATGV